MIEQGRNRIALDITALSRGGAGRGIGRYVTAIIRSLEDNNVPTDFIETRRNISPRVQEWADLYHRKRLISRLSPVLYHAPTVFQELHSFAPSVVSILDIIPLEAAGYRRTGVKTGYFFRKAACADGILTLSGHSAARIVEVLQVAPERIKVAPLPPSPEFLIPRSTEAIESVLKRFDVGLSSYIVAVGDFASPDPRKRLDWLPPLAEQIYRDVGITTIVVGALSDKALEPQAWIRGLGRLSDEELACVYAGASLFVYTTSYEGQGLPALEAITCGTPVVCMLNSSLPEVVQDAGVLVDEEGPVGTVRLADACSALLTDPRRLSELSSLAQRRGRTNEAGQFATNLLSIYRQAGWQGMHEEENRT